MIQSFNRSRYEDILFPFVHKLLSKKEISERMQAINDFEKHLEINNTIILKFYLIFHKKSKRKD